MAWIPEIKVQLPDNEEDITSDSDYEDDWVDDIMTERHSYEY